MTDSAPAMRAEKRRSTGGGANMSAAPVSRSVGVLIRSSSPKVMRLRSGCAGAGGVEERRTCPSSIQRFVPSASAAR